MLSSSAGDTMFELLGEEPLSGGSAGLDFDLPPLSPASADELASASAGSPLDGDVVFGSYLVDSKSPTPYTDATQVNTTAKAVINCWQPASV